MFNKTSIMGFDIVFFAKMMMTVSCDDSSQTCTSMLGVYGLNMLLTVVNHKSIHKSDPCSEGRVELDHRK